jgi:ABC-2 type transport system ATP-binding protein
MKLYINNISKSFKKNLVLDDITCELESGKVYGFVGRNGCGKTMLFRP